MNPSVRKLLLERLEGAHIEANCDSARLAPALNCQLEPGLWLPATWVAKGLAMRWAAFWVREAGDQLEAFSCFESRGDYVVFSTRVERDQPLTSIAAVYPAADRPERHAHDLLGLQFSQQPDDRRWTRHAAWGKDEFPLRSDFQPTAPQGITPPDRDYPFLRAKGAGAYEIPVGPVHAGIIEPGHFRFQAMGETVLNLEQHLGYVHKGIEKIAVGRDLQGLVRLAGRVSGDSCVAHAWAACMAAERALEVEIPQRANILRGILCERERVANHLGDIGAICNDVGFAFALYQLSRLKEELVRENAKLFGHRFMMDCLVPGGVTVDLDQQAIDSMFNHTERLQQEVTEIIDTLERSESLEDRLMTTGRLEPEQAELLGCVGYVGRASGVDFDVRRDATYCPYHLLEVSVPGYRAGDVAARAKVRAEEINISLGLIRRLLELLEPGEIRVPVEASGPAEGLGMVDGWRGEIISYLALDEQGRVERFFPRDPSWLTWPALELLQQGNIVPDFPVCNKSVNGSYSGQDL